LEVVFGSDDDYLYALNGEDGSLLWEFETGGVIKSSPTLGDVDGDGKIDIAVASWDGYLYLFEASAPYGKVVWSRWHGDAQGTGNYKNALAFARANLKGTVFAGTQPQKYPENQNIPEESQKQIERKENTGEVEPTLTAKNCQMPNPNYYLFAVFIYRYKHLPSLPFVKNDINLIKTLATCYIGVPKNHIKILINPSKDEFLGELAAFVEKIRRPDSLLYFYYSGHGITDSFGNFYFLPYAARVDNKVLLKLTSISLEEVENLLKEANGRKIALVDACRNLATDKGIAIGGFGVKDPKLAIIFSTSQGSVSTADREGKHSAFTKALYKVVSEGLANLDFNNDQYVEIKEIEHSLRRWVKNFSRNPKQEPTVKGNKDLPLFPVNY